MTFLQIVGSLQVFSAGRLGTFVVVVFPESLVHAMHAMAREMIGGTIEHLALIRCQRLIESFKRRGLAAQCAKLRFQHFLRPRIARKHVMSAGLLERAR